MIPEDGMKLSDVQYEKELTPERVRTTFVLIARAIALREESIRTMRELERTLAVKVGKERIFAEQVRYGKGAPVCERCRGVIGSTTSEWAVEFDGRWWHKRNCQGKAG